MAAIERITGRRRDPRLRDPPFPIRQADGAVAAKRNLPRLHEDWRISEISSSKTAAETGPRNRVLKSFPTRLPWPNRLR